MHEYRMRKHPCQVNKQDLCHRRAPSGVPGRAPPGQPALPAPATWQAAPPSCRRTAGEPRAADASRRRDRSGTRVGRTGGTREALSRPVVSSRRRLRRVWAAGRTLLSFVWPRGARHGPVCFPGGPAVCQALERPAMPAHARRGRSIGEGDCACGKTEIPARLRPTRHITVSPTLINQGVHLPALI